MCYGGTSRERELITLGIFERHVFGPGEDDKTPFEGRAKSLGVSHL
jgi:hypothetical protein